MIVQRIVRTGDFPTEWNTGCIAEEGKSPVQSSRRFMKSGLEAGILAFQAGGSGIEPRRPYVVVDLIADLRRKAHALGETVQIAGFRIGVQVDGHQ